MLRHEIEMGLLPPLSFYFTARTNVRWEGVRLWLPSVSGDRYYLVAGAPGVLHGFGGHSSTLQLIRNEFHGDGNG